MSLRKRQYCEYRHCRSVCQESQPLWIAARCLDLSSIKTSWASLPAKQAITSYCYYPWKGHKHGDSIQSFINLVKPFSEYLAYEILLRPDSWQGFLYIYLLPFPRLQTLCIKSKVSIFILDDVTVKTNMVWRLMLWRLRWWKSVRGLVRNSRSFLRVNN